MARSKAILLANLIPVIVFAIEAARGARHTQIELAGAALLIGALVANNVYLRRKVAPQRG